jgi:hypothetical protein
MTNQELDQALTEVKAEIEGLGPEKELTNRQWRRRIRLVERREVMEKIRKARLQSDLSREAQLMAFYQLLLRESTMNPFWYYLSRLKIKSTIWF